MTDSSGVGQECIGVRLKKRSDNAEAMVMAVATVAAMTVMVTVTGDDEDDDGGIGGSGIDNGGDSNSRWAQTTTAHLFFFQDSVVASSC